MISASRLPVNRPLSESKRVVPSKSASKKTDSADIIPASMGTRSLTPLDFENFLPWIVKELNGSKLVVVRKKLQEDYYQKRVNVNTRVRFVQTNGSINLSTTSSATVKTFLSRPSDFVDEDAAIQLTATYDHIGRLVEIAFIDCSLPINRQIMKIISLCLPFHAMLTKLIIKEKGLNCGILYEIAKFLPFSNLTDICLDSCYVRQGNYYILLDQETSLKCLSLSNCNISDVVCQEIAVRIEFHRPASKNLRVLNLSSNKITDVGALALGHALRTNRCLLHLDLCNNKLSAVGAHHVLVHLSKFQLTTSEVIDMKRQVKEYFEKEAAAVDKCLTQIQPYRPENTVLKDGYRYCIGNLTLCSLNLGFNNLDYFSVTEIVETLKYQNSLDKSKGAGLMRLVIEGNKLPESCEEYNCIKMYLKQATDNYMPRAPPLSSKLRMDSLTSLKIQKKSLASQSRKRKP